MAYKYGTYSRLGLVCEKTPAEDPRLQGEEQSMEVDEESKGPSELHQFNIDTYLKHVHLQS